MELTNKRVSYNVRNSNENLSLTGFVELNADDKINTFNGNFALNENHAGNFWYSETVDNKININLTDIAADNTTIADALVKETINEIKETLK